MAALVHAAAVKVGTLSATDAVLQLLLDDTPARQATKAPNNALLTQILTHRQTRLPPCSKRDASESGGGLAQETTPHGGGEAMAGLSRTRVDSAERSSSLRAAVCTRPQSHRRLRYVFASPVVSKSHDARRAPRSPLEIATATNVTVAVAGCGTNHLLTRAFSFVLILCTFVVRTQVRQVRPQVNSESSI